MNSLCVNDNLRTCSSCALPCSLSKFLSESEHEIINNHRIEVRYKAGDLIIKQGTPSNSIPFVRKGLVKVYVEGLRDKDLILALVKPVQFISGPEMYYNKIYNYSATALTNTECCFVDDTIFKQLISENRALSEAFITEFCRRSINTLRSIVSLTQKKMPGRIAEGILYLSKVLESDLFDMPLSKKELGDLTSMTRESVIRILHQLSEDGIVGIKGNSIEIKDKTKLISISNLG